MFSHLILQCPKFSLIVTEPVNKLSLKKKKSEWNIFNLVLSKPGENNQLVLPQVEHAGFLLAAERTPHLSVVTGV